MGKKGKKKGNRPAAVKSTSYSAVRIPQLDAKGINIYVDPEVWRKMKYWVEKAPGEVSGLGKVEIVDGDFIISSI